MRSEIFILYIYNKGDEKKIYIIINRNIKKTKNIYTYKNNIMRKLNGLQKQALALYKEYIKMTYTKPVQNQFKFKKYSKKLFYDKLHTIDRKDFSTIEYLLRFGARKLESLQNKQVKDINI